MIKGFTRKKGFTLFEVIIAVCVVSIMSVGIHGMYIRLIKSTKESEEQQRFSVIAKRTLEDLKSVQNNNFTYADGKMQVAGLGFINDDPEKDPNKEPDYKNEFDDDIVKGGKLNMTEGADFFKQTLYLKCYSKENSNKSSNESYYPYVYCKQSDPACKYTEDITINKIKAKYNSESQDLNLDSADIKLDDDDKKKDEDNEKIKDLKYNISKEEKEDKPKFQEKELKSKDESFILDIYFEKRDSEHVKVTIKNNGIILKSEDDVEIDLHKNNKVCVHLNFENYNLKENEIIKFKINMHNSIHNDNTECYVYTENAQDAEFETKFSGNYVYYQNTISGDIVNQGPLYSINVVVKKKGENREIFNGSTSRNINIENKNNSQG